MQADTRETWRGGQPNTRHHRPASHAAKEYEDSAEKIAPRGFEFYDHVKGKSEKFSPKSTSQEHRVHGVVSRNVGLSGFEDRTHDPEQFIGHVV